jgi:hypothetical protein
MVRLSGKLLRHPAMQNAIPLGTSVLLHAGILLLGYATFQAVRTVRALVREQVIIPSADIVEGVGVGGVPNPTLGADPNITNNAQLEITAQAQVLAERSAIQIGNMKGDSVTGFGPGTATLSGSGIGSVTGTVGGSLGGSPFGVPGGSGNGPRSPFMGVSGNAYRVAYICDASFTMFNARQRLIAELKSAVDHLKPVQLFNILFFSSAMNDGFEQFSGQLLPATPQNKLAAVKPEEGWIERRYRPDDGGSAIPALRAVMTQKPELVFLLTDGFDDPNDANLADKTREEIRLLNANRQVKIHTILVERGDVARARAKADKERTPDEKELVADADRLQGVLQQIAQDNGGVFKFVSYDDIR